MRLLNEEEIARLPESCIDCGGRDEKDVAKAQHQLDLKDFREELEAVCTHEELWEGLMMGQLLDRLEQAEEGK